MTHPLMSGVKFLWSGAEFPYPELNLLHPLYCLTPIVTGGVSYISPYSLCAEHLLQGVFKRVCPLSRLFNANDFMDEDTQLAVQHRQEVFVQIPVLITSME